jgi:DNA-nicking Smr family endonuclease
MAEDPWDQVKKTVKPLKKAGKGPLLPTVPKKITKRTPQETVLPPLPLGTQARALRTEAQTDLSFKGTRKLKRKTPEARLDLHGYTQAEAFPLLQGFILRCYAAGKQELLIITGKGRTTPEGAEVTGVLRQALPAWLALPELNPLIHFYTHAHPQDGGSGAFYVRLRKIK